MKAHHNLRLQIGCFQVPYSPKVSIYICVIETSTIDFQTFIWLLVPNLLAS